MEAALIGVAGGVLTLLLSRIPALSPRGARRARMKRDLELVHLAEPGAGREALARSLDEELAAMAARTGVWAPWTWNRVSVFVLAGALVVVGAALVLVDLPEAARDLVVSFVSTIVALVGAQLAFVVARRARAAGEIRVWVRQSPGDTERDE